jgi:hypothetical protein
MAKVRRGTRPGDLFQRAGPEKARLIQKLCLALNVRLFLLT